MIEAPKTRPDDYIPTRDGRDGFGWRSYLYNQPEPTDWCWFMYPGWNGAHRMRRCDMHPAQNVWNMWWRQAIPPIVDEQEM